MKLRGVAGLAVFLLGATTLLTGCDDKTASSPAPAPVTTKAPQTPAADQSDEPSGDPTTPADEETKGSSGDAAEFCKLVYSKVADLGSGKDVTQVSKEELQKTIDAMAELADKAPAEVKGPLTTMHQIYADFAAGKVKPTDTAEMQKLSGAVIKYSTWTTTNCPPPSGN
jgi:hypothetical protein